MMPILAFDTTQDACSVAIGDQGLILAQTFKQIRQGHAEHLLPMIEEALGQANISYSEIESIAVTVGPGTFTGIRVGLAAARALALVLDVSLQCFSTLEVLAQAAIHQNIVDHGGVIVAIDARRGQLYMQSFDSTGQALSEPMVDAIGHHIAPSTLHTGLIVGSGAAILQSVLQDWRINEDIQRPDAAILATASEQWRWRISQRSPSPIYLRAPDAKLSAGQNLLGSKVQ